MKPWISAEGWENRVTQFPRALERVTLIGLNPIRPKCLLSGGEPFRLSWLVQRLHSGRTSGAFARILASFEGWEALRGDRETSPCSARWNNKLDLRFIGPSMRRSSPQMKPHNPLFSFIDWQWRNWCPLHVSDNPPKTSKYRRVFDDNVGVDVGPGCSLCLVRAVERRVRGVRSVKQARCFEDSICFPANIWTPDSSRCSLYEPAKGGYVSPFLQADYPCFVHDIPGNCWAAPTPLDGGTDDQNTTSFWHLASHGKKVAGSLLFKQGSGAVYYLSVATVTSESSLCFVSWKGKKISAIFKYGRTSQTEYQSDTSRHPHLIIFLPSLFLSSTPSFWRISRRDYFFLSLFLLWLRRALKMNLQFVIVFLISTIEFVMGASVSTGVRGSVPFLERRSRTQPPQTYMDVAVSVAYGSWSRFSWKLKDWHANWHLTFMQWSIIAGLWSKDRPLSWLLLADPQQVGSSGGSVPFESKIPSKTGQPSLSQFLQESRPTAWI